MSLHVTFGIVSTCWEMTEYSYVNEIPRFKTNIKLKTPVVGSIDHRIAPFKLKINFKKYVTFQLTFATVVHYQPGVAKHRLQDKDLWHLNVTKHTQLLQGESCLDLEKNPAEFFCDGLATEAVPCMRSEIHYVVPVCWISGKPLPLYQLM